MRVCCAAVAVRSYYHITRHCRFDLMRGGSGGRDRLSDFYASAVGIRGVLRDVRRNGRVDDQRGRDAVESDSVGLGMGPRDNEAQIQ